MDIKKSLHQKVFETSLYLVACSMTFLLLFVFTYRAAGQGNPDDSYWNNIFARPERSVALTIKDADHVYYAGVYRIPHSPVLGGSDEDKYLLAEWDKDHWVLTGKVKQIYDYDGNASITDFDVIRTVAVDQNSIYIGGNFQIITMQGDTCFNIAQWYGGQWHPVGKGTDGRVNVIAPTGTGEVYVGGNFTYLRDGTRVNDIAVTNGTSWSTVGNSSAFGVNGEVFDIAVSNTAVFVGGYFSTAGGNNVNNVASYNWNTQTWGIMGDGVNSLVRAVAVYGNEVYIGGDFTKTAGGDSLKGVGMYQTGNNQWVPLGHNKIGKVLDIEASSAGNVYAVADFSVETGISSTSLAMWDGSQWKPLPGDGHNVGVDGTKMAVTSGLTADIIYLGLINDTYMITSDGRVMERYAKWDGSQWHGLGYGVGTFFDVQSDNEINDLAWDGTYLYAGGELTYVGDDSVHYLAKWDPANMQWSSLGTSGLSAPGVVNALTYHNNALYIAGDFATADGMTVNNIVKWDGSKFIALGQGLSHPQYNTTVNDIVFVNDTLFAVGDEFFNDSGNIAYFDGTSWHSIAPVPLYSLGDAKSIAYYHGKLYAMTGRGYVYEYDKSQDKWNQIGSSASFPVYSSIYADKNYLYVMGQFSEVNGVSANNIARWDGTSWSAMGSGFSGPVYDVYTNGSDVYAGGKFITSGNDTLWSIARWNGTKWIPLGSGLRRYIIVDSNIQASVRSMVGTPSGLFAGGAFNYAGIGYSNDLALWTNFTPVYTGSPRAFINEIYPNSGANITGHSVQASTSEFLELVASTNIKDQSNYKISLYDTTGKPYDVKTLDQFTPGATKDSLATYYYDYPNGIADKGGVVLSYNGSPLSDQFISYGGSFIADSGDAKGMQSINVGMASPGYSISLKGNGISYDDFTWDTLSAPTPGDYNLGENIEATGVQQEFSQNPYNFKLYQNYPNPFNPTTTISYSLLKAGPVKLRIYDVLGRLVATLVDEQQKAGMHVIRFNASRLASGVYFYRISTPGFTQTKKLLLLK